MTLSLISKRVLNELDKKKAAIQSDPDFDKSLTDHITAALDAEALSHSRKLELEDVLPSELHPKNGLESAWELGVSTLDQPLSTASVMELARHIDPQNFCYRSEMARSKFDNKVYTNPVKIPEKMDGLVKDLNGLCMHPVEKAAYAHFSIAHIHPFTDGNGRTARLMQNLLLKKAGFPPAIIYSGERDFYLNMIGAADKGRIARKMDSKPWEISSHESDFYSYIASKVNLSLDKIADHLTSLPHYEIHLNADSPGALITAKKRVAAYLRKCKDDVSTVRLKDTVLYVAGEAKPGSVCPVLDAVHGIKGYEVKRIR